MLGKNIEEVNVPVTVLLQPKVEMEETGEREVKTEYITPESPVSEQNDSEEEELKPLAAVYIKTEVEDEETEEQDHSEVYPLAYCEVWDETKPAADSLLSRVKKEEVDAGISDERSEQAAAEKMNDNAIYASGSGSSSNRAESLSEEHETSNPESEDVLAHTNRQPFAHVHCSDIPSFKKTLKGREQELQEEYQHVTCDICQQQFADQSVLERHTRAHTSEADKEMKFPCETCGKEFKLDYLKIHQRLHTGDKPHVCDQCGESFTRVSNLSVHRRKHTGKQPYVCSICNKQFAYKSVLVMHTRRHLNIKPFECKECGKTFVDSNHYTMHLRVHTGEKPYNCRFCKATFAKNSNRRRHEKQHSKTKAVQCEECGKGLASTKSLKVHMRLHTGK